jgi:DNA invertase Pin-like site-specific DNA recombinase
VSREESASIETQEKDLRALAASHGFAVAHVRVDDDKSGALPITRRPAFAEWLDDLRSGRVSVLLVRDFSRLSREGLRAAADVIELLGSTRGRLISSLDRLDSASPGFEMVAAVLSVQAKGERDATAARVTIRQKHDRVSGTWTKDRPTGYLVRGGRLVQAP